MSILFPVMNVCHDSDLPQGIGIDLYENKDDNTAGNGNWMKAFNNIMKVNEDTSKGIRSIDIHQADLQKAL
eukprot:10653019-Ditylum_brightwellii.AAC.1